MIYTLTLNPAIDLFIDTPTLQAGTVNRTNRFDAQANGKGVNVSFILQKLGVTNTALGVGGGFTLDYIVSVLDEIGIPNHFYRVPGVTRINTFTHLDGTNEEFKLVNPGPYVPAATVDALMQQLSSLKPDDTLCISGSFSPGIPDDFLIRVSELSQAKGFQVVIDTAGSRVKTALPFHPRLIKPNDEEVKAWFNITDELSIRELGELAQRLVLLGAQNVLLSLGDKGAILANSQGTLYGNAPHIEVLNTAGAGDTMLGTFLAGWAQGLSDIDNLRRAIAAGSDTASQAGLTDFEGLDNLLAQIKIIALEENV
ncbi:1-phosphofructokinase [Lacticaseibacillus saniviri]|uniref:Tagatose-6-phosphate kinase n=1 Tax=Lacticaseibacillus saniviri JCM 17471 = DSM 24301 TaxID=1293598 RepID=A0A0R2MN12_9LACO|nr:1-phosphofructokinase [Lacticaseibacillus saniviri]KRO15096.1 Fructose-1-phosphate kinase related fructose-6-phosphate kinase (PfkB) [Lacticaseibacillus saniviri JCM 17471 = DSM 24301]MCG4281194.1 1-phosphofructokinase [Lacticaseibacillus saniviri]